jgi:hypothetical protein
MSDGSKGITDCKHKSQAWPRVQVVKPVTPDPLILPTQVEINSL